MNFIQAIAAARKRPSLDIVRTNLIHEYAPHNSASYPGTGTIFYDLIGSDNLTLRNGVVWNASGYFELNGVDQAIEASVGSIAFGSFTIASFGRHTAKVGLDFLYGYVNPSTLGGAHIYWNANTGNYQYRIEDASGNFNALLSGFTPTLGAWNYYALTWDNTTKLLTAYLIDDSGTTNVNSTTAATIDMSASIPSLTAFNSWRNFPWAGDIGASQTYSRTLSQSEIEQNFNALKAIYGL